MFVHYQNMSNFSQHFSRFLCHGKVFVGIIFCLLSHNLCVWEVQSLNFSMAICCRKATTDAIINELYGICERHRLTNFPIAFTLKKVMRKLIIVVSLLLEPLFLSFSPLHSFVVAMELYYSPSISLLLKLFKAISFDVLTLH